MWPYYLLVIYFFVCSTFLRKKIGERNKWKYLLLFIPLFLFAALRGNGSGDYFGYLDRGENIKTVDDILHMSVGMEIGYKFLAYIVYCFHLPRQFTVIFMNLISLTCISSFIKKYSKDWAFSLLLFLPLFFQFDMHASRTAVAIGICAAGYTFVENRKFLKYILCIALACGFHTTAVVSVPVYFLYGKRISVKAGIVIVVAELLTIRVIPIYNILYFILDKLHLSYFSIKLVEYVSSEAYGYAMPLYDPRIWIPIFIFLISKITISNFYKNDNDRCMENCVLLNAILLITFSNTTFFAYRLSAFYYVYIIILAPTIILKYLSNFSCNEKRIKLFYIISVFFTVLNLFYGSIMFEYLTVFQSKEGLIPY